MATIKVLEENKRFMDEIGIYFPGLHGTCDQFRKSAIAYFVLFNLLISTFLCAMKIYNSSEFSHKSYTLMVLIVIGQAFSVFLNIKLKRNDAIALHHKLQSIVDKGSLWTLILWGSF